MLVAELPLLTRANPGTAHPDSSKLIGFLLALCLPKIPAAQVGPLFGFGGGRMSWLLREGPLVAA